MNFPNFPLYSSLKKDDFKELTSDEKDKFTDKVKDMGDEEHKTIYALIRAYHLDHDINIQELPYSGKTLKSGIKFDFDHLPSKLQYMLFNFSCLSKM
jgi:hypothetical protein